MSYTPYVLPLIAVRGTPFEIGKQYGELARVRIQVHLTNQKALMALQSPDNPEWWRARLPPCVQMYEQCAPHMVEEMHGIARGAELSIDDVYLLNMRDELLSPLKTTEECTAFGCSGDVTLDGEPLLGQTKDTGALSADLYVVLAMYQKGRPDLLQMPYAGELGVFGCSSTGMSVFGNSMALRNTGEGKLPWSLLRRLALEANDIAEVVALVERYGICGRGGGNLVIGDRSGRAIGLEHCGQENVVVEQTDGILVHTNHPLSHLAQLERWAEPEKSGSRQRHQRLTQLLDAERGRLTAPLALHCLTDHDGYPRSICRHVPQPGDIETTAAIVVEPTRGLLSVVRGQPCRGYASVYSL